MVTGKGFGVPATRSSERSCPVPERGERIPRRWTRSTVLVPSGVCVLGTSHTLSCTVSLLLARAMWKIQSHKR